MQNAWGGGAKPGGAEDGRTLQWSVPLTRGTPAAYAPVAPRVAVRSLRSFDRPRETPAARALSDQSKHGEPVTANNLVSVGLVRPQDWGVGVGSKAWESGGRCFRYLEVVGNRLVQQWQSGYAAVQSGHSEA